MIHANSLYIMFYYDTQFLWNKSDEGNSLLVQLLELSAFTASPEFNPGQGTKVRWSGYFLNLEITTYWYFHFNEILLSIPPKISNAELNRAERRRNIYRFTLNVYKLDGSTQPRALQGQAYHIHPHYPAQGLAQQTFNKHNICQLRREAAYHSCDLLIS